jgi:hypothetical protein
VTALERSLRALKTAAYGFVLMELLNITIQTCLMVAAEIATRGRAW